MALSRSQTLCIFTGTRAEYGLLKPLIGALKASDDFGLQLIAAGAHLAPSHGSTWREIEVDGFTIDERVEILMDADTATAVTTAMGLALLRLGDAFARLRPDALVLLGDRYEAFAAAAAAAIHRLPVIHLHGGEQTLGAVDDMFRHAITKLSHLHLTSTEAYRERVIQMGEPPERVFAVGALGVANALTVPKRPRVEILERLGLAGEDRYLLVTFHPATMESGSPLAQLEALVAALKSLQGLCFVFTGANADLGGRSLNEALRILTAKESAGFRFFNSLGLDIYLNAAREAEAVVGNSSSGIIEVPSLGVPVVDIGSRQAGRVRSQAVIHAETETAAIEHAIRVALSGAFRAAAAGASNPYERPDTVGSIMRILEAADFSSLASKGFHDIRPSAG